MSEVSSLVADEHAVTALKNQSSSGDPRQPEHATHTYTNISEIANCWEGGRFESNASPNSNLRQVRL